MGATTTRFYLSANAAIDGGDTPLGARPVPALAAGVSSTATTSLTIPASTSTGSYYLVALADGDSSVVETNENNNLTFRPLALGGDSRAGLPDGASNGRVWRRHHRQRHDDESGQRPDWRDDNELLLLQQPRRSTAVMSCLVGGLSLRSRRAPVTLVRPRRRCRPISQQAPTTSSPEPTARMRKRKPRNRTTPTHARSRWAPIFA